MGKPRAGYKKPLPIFFIKEKLEHAEQEVVEVVAEPHNPKSRRHLDFQ